MEALAGQPVDVANSVVGSTATAKMPDAGILGGVPFNEFFVAFGQFFDHGLDFISKNGGYVLIKLSPNDPLYDPDASPANPFANTMMLSRAKLTNPNADFTTDSMGNVVLKDGVMPTFNNNTGLLIDQSQTYGSHVSVNVLVRQYDANGVGTGKLITGAEDGDRLGARSRQLGRHEGQRRTHRHRPSRHGCARRAVHQGERRPARSTFTAQHDFLFTSAMSIADIDAALVRRSDDRRRPMRHSYADVAAYDPFNRDPATGNVLYSNQAILIDIRYGARSEPARSARPSIPIFSPSTTSSGRRPRERERRPDRRSPRVP